MKLVGKDEIRSRESYALVTGQADKNYVGLAVYYGVLCDMIPQSLEKELKDNQTIDDPSPSDGTTTLKQKLCSLALDNIDKLDYHEIRVINLLAEFDRKDVAKILGIKKARLSQIIAEIRLKLSSRS